MNLIGTEIPSNMFFWHPEDGEFRQEASSLRGYKFNSQIWDDSADAGFVMVSDRTGESLPFYLSEVKTDNEGDVLAWHYKAYSKDPKLSKLTAVVWND